MFGKHGMFGGKREMFGNSHFDVKMFGMTCQCSRQVGSVRKADREVIGVHPHAGSGLKPLPAMADVAQEKEKMLMPSHLAPYLSFIVDLTVSHWSDLSPAESTEAEGLDPMFEGNLLSFQMVPNYLDIRARRPGTCLAPAKPCMLPGHTVHAPRPYRACSPATPCIAVGQVMHRGGQVMHRIGPNHPSRRANTIHRRPPSHASQPRQPLMVAAPIHASP
ncbi:hypothetical protein BDZ89DRAFT_1176268 [Hymenopellis radicata]|nr:hypothetical protein BDZ89DRAFT_1176268 [Hymenopellis radicata]